MSNKPIDDGIANTGNSGPFIDYPSFIRCDDDLTGWVSSSVQTFRFSPRPTMATYKAAVRRKHEQIAKAQDRIRELEDRLAAENRARREAERGRP